MLFYTVGSIQTLYNDVNLNISTIHRQSQGHCC